MSVCQDSLKGYEVFFFPVFLSRQETLVKHIFFPNSDFKLGTDKWITLHIFYTNIGINLNYFPKSK